MRWACWIGTVMVTAGPVPSVFAQPCPSVVVRVDNDIAGSGYSEDPAENWLSRPTGACHGTYRYLSHTVGDGSRRGRAIWRPAIPRTGWYEVVTRFRATVNRTADADYVMHDDAGGATRRVVSQRHDGDCTAETLGTFFCRQGGRCRLILDGTDDAESDAADLTTFTLVACGDAPPVTPPPATGPCAGIANTAGYELCGESATTCEGVFTDGSGCNAYCAAAGMACAAAYGGGTGCSKEPQNVLACGVASGHTSDWCECVALDQPPPPAGGVCDGIGGNQAFEVCLSSEDSCAGTFSDGTGCNAYCAAAQMVCVARYGGEPGCVKEPQNPLPCGADTGHASDWCECEVPSGDPLPPESPMPGADAPLVRVGAALTWCGQPVRLIGYGNYGILAESAFDYDVFFDGLVAAGLSFVRVWGQYHWANDLTPFDGVRGDWDLQTANVAYYARLKRLVESAASRGLIVMVTLFDSVQLEGSSTDGNRWIDSPYRQANNRQAYLQDPTQFNLLTGSPPVWAEVNQPYIERVVDALCDQPNVIYEIMNEPESSGGDPGRGTPPFIDGAIAEVHRLLARPACTGSRVIASNDNTLRTLGNPMVDLIAAHVTPAAAERYRGLGKPVMISNDGDTSQVTTANGFGQLDPTARADRIGAYARRTFAGGHIGQQHLEILDKDMHGASWMSRDYEPRPARASAEVIDALRQHVVTPPWTCRAPPVVAVPDAGVPSVPPDAGVVSMSPDAGEAPPLPPVNPLRPPSQDGLQHAQVEGCGCAAARSSDGPGWLWVFACGLGLRARRRRR